MGESSREGAFALEPVTKLQAFIPFWVQVPSLEKITKLGYIEKKTGKAVFFMNNLLLNRSLRCYFEAFKEV